MVGTPKSVPGKGYGPMRLACKIAGAFVLLLGSLFAGLWLRAGRERRLLESRLESSLGAGVRRLAEHCASTRDSERERRCLEGLAVLVEMVGPEAFSQALLLDAQGRLRVHSDFLSGDRTALGRAAGQPFARRALDDPGDTLVQRGVPYGSSRLRVFSARTPAPERWTLACAFLEDDLLRIAHGRGGRGGLMRAGLLGVGGCLLLAAALVLLLLRPLGELVAAARRVAGGDLLGQVPELNDEFAVLGVEFNRMTRRLAELDDLKDCFVTQVTHDLKTPLSAMQGYVQLMLLSPGEPLSAQQRRSLELVHQNGQVLADLINNVLELSRLESGRLRLRPEPIDVRTEVEGVAELLAARAQELEVTLGAQAEDSAPEAYADRDALRRILMNLIGNALKFTPRGGGVQVHAGTSAPGEVLFAVEDNGIGIPKDRLPMLFKKFSQVPETKNRVRASGGTGLGLAICKELVEAHGGRIWARSRMFRGSTFCFTLPAKAPAAPAPPGPEPQTQ